MDWIDNKRWSLPVHDMIGKTMLSVRVGRDDNNLFYIVMLADDGTMLRFTADYEDWGERGSEAFIESNKFAGKRFVCDLEPRARAEERDAEVMS